MSTDELLEAIRTEILDFSDGAIDSELLIARIKSLIEENTQPLECPECGELIIHHHMDKIR